MDEPNYDRVEEFDEITGVPLLFKKHFLGNLPHRLDGPAFVYRGPMPGPSRFSKDHWFYMGKHIVCSSQEEFESIIALRAFW